MPDRTYAISYNLNPTNDIYTLSLHDALPISFANPTPEFPFSVANGILRIEARRDAQGKWQRRSEEHTSELQSPVHLVCRILLDKKNILKRRGCLTVPRLTLMSLIKMILVMVSVAAISKTFGLLRFLLRLSFLATCRPLPHLLTLWVCKLLMLIWILAKNVITSCSVTMVLFLRLEVKPLMTLPTVLFLSCALISGHLAMMLMELTKRR